MNTNVIHYTAHVFCYWHGFILRTPRKRVSEASKCLQPSDPLCGLCNILCFRNLMLGDVFSYANYKLYVKRIKPSIRFSFQRRDFRLLFNGTSSCFVSYTVKHLPVLHHSADYIFICFWIIEQILISLKIKHRLNFCLAQMQHRKLFSCIWRDVIKPSLWYLLYFCVYVFFISKCIILDFVFAFQLSYHSVWMFSLYLF